MKSVVSKLPNLTAFAIPAISTIIVTIVVNGLKSLTVNQVMASASTVTNKGGFMLHIIGVCFVLYFVVNTMARIDAIERKADKKKDIWK